LSGLDNKQIHIKVFFPFIKARRVQLEQNPSLIAEAEARQQELVKRTDELDTLREQARELADKLTKSEIKFRDEKERAAAESQRSLDDLQLKLANLDLKNKQMTLEENKESYAVRRKVVALEEELSKVRAS